MKSTFSIIILIAALLLMPALRAEAYEVGIGCYGTEKCSFPMLEDIVNEIYRRAGMKIQIEYFPLLRDLKSVDSGTTDASAARAMDVLDRYKNIIPVPTPLGELEYHMYYLVRSVPPINWDSIKNMRVGIVRGTATVLREAQKHDIIITLVPSHKLGFEMLERKRIDILIANSLVGDIHAAKLKDWIKVDSRLLYKANVYHMVNKGHHDLVPRLDSIIKDMQQEGLIKKIVQKYRPGADITFPDQNPNRESASSLSGNN